jgi:hypothetical protein
MIRRAVPTIALSVGLLIAMRTEMLGAINLSPAAAAQDPSKTATYTGKIVSQNGVRFILRDETNNSWYHPNQRRATRSWKRQNRGIDSQQRNMRHGEIINYLGSI